MSSYNLRNQTVPSFKSGLVKEDQKLVIKFDPNNKQTNKQTEISIKI